tara:strand:+ start:1542 stop:3215 length:1674 start_codon:yes stop_codon:yes gene_type:complete
MGKAEREGQNYWGRFLDAGVVENTLLWTDSDIKVDNTIGRTRDALGTCWPIDAAVAYTLANHGENAALTWKDMVNQNTRIASVMMTGLVGYGELVNPLSVSCGHDEVDCYEYHFPMPYRKTAYNGEEHIWFDMSSRLSNVYDDLESVPQEIQDLFTMRLTHNTGYVSVIKYLRTFPQLATWICEEFNADIFNFDENNRINSYYTKGVCGFAEDDPNHGFCSHHDSPKKSDWYMIKDTESCLEWETIWRRGKGRVVHYRWNNDQFRSRNLSNTIKQNIVIFDRVKRSLAQSIPEDVVIKHIKESLQRMKNWDGRCLVEKTGRGKTATHRWNSWGWLNEISVWVTDTRSKNRHENDTACRVCYAAGETEQDTGKPICRCDDGWKYVKYNSKKSYGHEIAKFEWRPMKQQYVYALGVGSYLLGNYVANTSKEASYYREMIAKMGSKMPLAKFTDRKWDLSTGQEELTIDGKGTNIQIRKLAVQMKMKWDKNPEDLPNAAEMKRMAMFGNPTEQNEALELCDGEIKCTGYIKSSYSESTIIINKMSLINTADNVMNIEGGN